MLAVHIPNPLPKSALGLHFSWMHPAGRLIWASVILVIGIVLVARSNSTEPYPVTPVGEPKLLIAKLEPFYAWARDLLAHLSPNLPTARI